MTIYLVCESDTANLDSRVIDQLIIQRHGLEVLVVGGGGDSGLGAIRQHLEQTDAVVSSPRTTIRSIAHSIEDRNFQPIDRVEASWLAGKRRQIWRRHEIENYLLHPSALVHFVTHQLPGCGLPETGDAAIDLLIQIGKAHLEDHVGERIKHLWQQQVQGYGLSFAPRRSAAHGAPVPLRQQWCPDLEAECERLLGASQSVSSLPNLQPGQVTARYDELHGRLQADSFFPSL